MQEHEEQLNSHNVAVVSVFREEQQGRQGLKRIREQVESDFVLTLDLNAEKTRDYGKGPPTFNTFIIDPDGIVRNVLRGSTYNRPTGKQIVTAFEQAAAGQ